jgi:hypothetical protein
MDQKMEDMKALEFCGHLPEDVMAKALGYLGFNIKVDGAGRMIENRDPYQMSPIYNDGNHCLACANFIGAGPNCSPYIVELGITRKNPYHAGYKCFCNKGCYLLWMVENDHFD